MKFDEHTLELSILELFKDEKYSYLPGSEIHREKSAVLLVEDIKQYLTDRYSSVGLTRDEMDAIIHKIDAISGSVYEANKAFIRLLMDGFIFTRNDRSQKDIYISLLKACIFGALIALVCATKGYQTRGGAREVGTSTTQAAILSTIYMLVADFLVNFVFYIV